MPNETPTVQYAVFTEAEGKIDENLTYEEAYSFYGREAECTIVQQ